jgi:hypothetical protein
VSREGTKGAKAGKGKANSPSPYLRLLRAFAGHPVPKLESRIRPRCQFRRTHDRPFCVAWMDRPKDQPSLKPQLEQTSPALPVSHETAAFRFSHLQTQPSSGSLTTPTC